MVLLTQGKLSLTILAAVLTLAFAQDACSDNCLDCTNPPQACTVCGPGKVLRPDGTGCDDCPTACGKCEYDDSGRASVCVECYNSFNGYNYVKSSFGVCTRCSANCLECYVSVSGGTKCSRCEDGYTLDKITQLCSGCTIGCEKCDGYVCSDVQEGYRLDLSISSHVAECSANCAECDKSGCLKCKDEFNVVDGSCQSCPTYCTQCSEDECQECYQGFGPKSVPTCDVCPPNCERCDSSGCIVCTTGYVPDSDESYKQCHRCPQHCHTCSYTADHQTRCAENGCQDLFALNPATGTCHKCDDNCYSTCVWETNLFNDFRDYNAPGAYAVDVNGPVCLNCKRGYGTTLYGQCAACPDNCLACYDASDPDDLFEGSDIVRMGCFSLQCKVDLMEDDAYVINGVTYPKYWEVTQDYFVVYDYTLWNDEDKKRSVPDKKLSAGAQYALSRKQRAVLYNHNIELTTEYIISQCCYFGYGIETDIWTDENGNIDFRHLCKACPDHCLACDAINIHLCKHCELGYVLSADRTECIEDDPYCFSKEAMTCTCYPFHQNADHIVNVIPDGPECLKCPDNCKFQEGATHCQVTGGVAMCTSCYDYYGTKDGLCARCGDGCITCSWTANVYSCSDCDDRTVLVNDECIDCPDDCANCDTTDGSTCVDCDPGYITDDNGLCVACPDACITSEDCTYDGESQAAICNSCDDGWVMVDGACTKCPDNCAECSEAAVCDVCEQYYGLLEDGTCQRCPSDCNECSKGECGVCTAGFYLNTGACGYCGSGCETCTESFGSMTCSQCLPGYIKDTANNCIACPSNCGVCDYTNGDVVCSECGDGHIVNDIGTCASCENESGIQGCESCHRDGETVLCDNCISGYSLKDDRSICVSCATLDNCNGVDDECADLAKVCNKCRDGFELENGECGIGCVLCDGAADVCGPNVAYNQSVFCPSGNCIVVKLSSDDQSHYYARGCDLLGLCDGDGNICETAGNETCKCCSTDMCNDFDISSTSVIIANFNMCIVTLIITLLICQTHLMLK